MPDRMKLLITDKGLQYEPDWCFMSNGDLIIKLADERTLSWVAQEFDGLEWLQYDEEKYTGFGVLKGIRRMTEYVQEPQKNILITLSQNAG